VCILCGELVMHVHWTDQASHDREYSNTVVSGELQRDRLRGRMHRVRYVNAVLSFYGLSFKDWQGSKYLLSDKKGQQKVVNDLGDMWPEAQKMAGKGIDPLDPALLDWLAREGCLAQGGKHV